MAQARQRRIGGAAIDAAARNLHPNQALAMREIVGREGFDVVLLAIVQRFVTPTKKMSSACRAFTSATGWR